MKRLLITGGSGFLGSRLTQLASASPPDRFRVSQNSTLSGAGAVPAQSKGASGEEEWEVYPTFFNTSLSHPNAIRLDLRDRAEVERTVKALRPEVIIHQAVSNRNAEHVAAIVPAARHIADVAIDVHARLIHVSSDMVFDGENPPYTEESSVAPANPYGAAKAFAEGLIAGMMPEALIVRPSLIYGFDPVDKQTGWIVEGIRKGETVRLFTDEIRCPIWVDTMALALLELAESKHRGILNIGGEPLNRWDYGIKMLSCLGLAPGPNVIPSTIAESGLKRPADLTMDTSRARRLLRTRLLTVEEAFSFAGRLW